MVELLRLYSNRQSGRKKLQNIRSMASSELRAPAQAIPRMQMNRLDKVAVGELIARYRAGAKINELARRFGVHRTTVSSLLGRHGVEVRSVGLSRDQIRDATRLYWQTISDTRH